MDSVLSAEGAILVQLKTIGGILLVLRGVVVSLLALRAPKGDLDARACLCHLSFWCGGPGEPLRLNRT